MLPGNNHYVIMLHGAIDVTGTSSRWSSIGLRPFTYADFLQRTHVLQDTTRFLIPCPHGPTLRREPIPAAAPLLPPFVTTFSARQNETNLDAMMRTLFPNMRTEHIVDTHVHEPLETMVPTEVTHDATDSTSRHTCAVCYEILDHMETVLRLPCYHMFHETCLLPWLEMDNTCPMCRTVVSPDMFSS